MKIAYLINQYPKVSHSFIRREIHALEEQGLELERISIRGWDEPLADSADVKERARTRYILQVGWGALMGNALRAGLLNPFRFVKALKLCLELGQRTDRPLWVHIAYLLEACWLKDHLRKIGVQHVHAHFATNPAEVALLTCAMDVNLSYSFTAHGTEAFDHPRFIALAEKVKASAFTVTVSSHGRSQILRLIDAVHWPKVHVVRCAVDRSFSFEADISPCLARRLVCIGRLSEEKGQLILVEALAHLKKDGVECELILGGDGPLRGQIEALAKKLGVTSQLTITGWLSSSQVREHMLGARAVVVPSFAEGLPVAIMEAMSLGRPVIATYVAGIPELVAPGISGWLVPAGDPIALAQAMSQALAADADELGAIGSAARQIVATQHDQSVSSRKLARLFGEARRPEGTTHDAHQHRALSDDGVAASNPASRT